MLFRVPPLGGFDWNEPAKAGTQNLDSKLKIKLAASKATAFFIWY
jgi:hypothetical protein